MDMDYVLLLEKAKFLFVFVYIIGLYTSWLLDVFDRLVSFLYKLFRQYMRLRRIKRRSLDGKK